jgi:hypothetical protein
MPPWLKYASSTCNTTKNAIEYRANQLRRTKIQMEDTIQNSMSDAKIKKNVILNCMYLSIKAKGASERFPVVGPDGHILARADLAEVGREVDAVPLVSSKAK